MGDEIMWHGYAKGAIPRENVVVLDNGTGYMKAGFASDHFPRVTFPAMVGRPLMRSDQVSGDAVLKDIMCGDECLPVMNQLDIKYPIREGQVVDSRWEDMDALWDYTFKKLNVETENSLALLTEAPGNSMPNRIKYLEYMFEKYNFRGCQLVVQVGAPLSPNIPSPSLFIAPSPSPLPPHSPQPTRHREPAGACRCCCPAIQRVACRPQAVLTLYANGLMTGVVLDSGDGVTHAVPVYNNAVLMPDNNKGGTMSLKVAGRHVTEHLQKLLEQSGYSFDLVRVAPVPLPPCPCPCARTLTPPCVFPGLGHGAAEGHQGEVLLCLGRPEDRQSPRGRDYFPEQGVQVRGGGEIGGGGEGFRVR